MPEFKIAVIGAGQMGSGIAQVAATFKNTVTLVDTFPNAKEKAFAGIQKSLAKLGQKEKIEESPESIMERLSFETSLESLKGKKLDFVIEAVPENLELKSKLFKELDAAIPKTCILCSNTSSISLTKLASNCQSPERVMGMHFMNPVPLMKLVELIPALQSSAKTVDSVKQLCKDLGKTAITSKDQPGFVINRILMPMVNEAIFALGEGLSSAEEIDVGMKLGSNQPMGPLALADFIGLDTCLSIMNVLHDSFEDSKYRAAPLLKQYVDAGWLGRKSGRGFYRYES